MDPNKAYNRSEAETRISRLAKPQRVYLFMPLVILAILALHPIFESHIPVMESVKNLLNPVAVCTIAALIVPGVKLDKESRQLYQALCVPTDAMNIKYITSLINTRHRTLQIIRGISIIASLVTFFIIYNRNGSGVIYACLLGSTMNFLGDKKYITEKLQDDIAAENIGNLTK